MKLASIENDTNQVHLAVVFDQDLLLDLYELRSFLPQANLIPENMKDLLAGGADARRG